MATVHSAPYGSWQSPITAALVASSAVRLDEIVLDGEDIYWVEMRPQEEGRSVIVVRRPDGTRVDVTPPGFSARTRVHEYGGGSYWVAGSVVYFANFADQRLYRQRPGFAPQPLTPAGMRYADGIVDATRRRIICVREDHTVEDREPVNTLVALDPDAGGPGEVLLEGHDFYSTPRLSPDGRWLSWLAWNHPHMPWTASAVWTAAVNADGSLRLPHCIAGMDGGESIFQPQWSPDNLLYFVSDRTGWWNIYRQRAGQIETVTNLEAEFGLPQWIFGMSTYGFVAPDRLVAACYREGVARLVAVDARSGAVDPFDLPFAEYHNLHIDARQAVFVAGAPDTPQSIVQVLLAGGQTKTLAEGSAPSVDKRYFSLPRAIEFPTSGGLTAHAFFYPPCNPDFEAPHGERPPLLVISHGGPTASTSSTLNLGVQYWTSRGFGVLDVNYGGSTSYGRRYRERLDDNWGVVDVDDCANGALYLARLDEVDGARLIIRGGSAGGYTTLCALAFRNVFAAGASFYGVGDLEGLARETHKFESRYLDGLIGPYPERLDLYREHSPLYHVEGIQCPVIFFQGMEDKVVPPNQAEEMVQALRRRKIPVAYVTYAGEAHGFRQEKNLIHAREAELYFYARVFGLTVADALPAIEIENL